MKKLIAVILIGIVVVSLVHSLLGNVFHESRKLKERQDFKGSSVKYIAYLYWMPVVKEKCEYGFDGSCDRHDSRSECTNQWDDMTTTEKKASVGTLFFNALLLLIAWRLWPKTSE